MTKDGGHEDLLSPTLTGVNYQAARRPCFWSCSPCAEGVTVETESTCTHCVLERQRRVDEKRY